MHASHTKVANKMGMGLCTPLVVTSQKTTDKWESPNVQSSLCFAEGVPCTCGTIFGNDSYRIKTLISIYHIHFFSLSATIYRTSVTDRETNDDNGKGL